jgi:hypothetical protein
MARKGSSPDFLGAMVVSRYEAEHRRTVLDQRIPSLSDQPPLLLLGLAVPKVFSPRANIRVERLAGERVSPAPSRVRRSRRWIDLGKVERCYVSALGSA